MIVCSIGGVVVGVGSADFHVGVGSLHLHPVLGLQKSYTNLILYPCVV